MTYDPAVIPLTQFLLSPPTAPRSVSQWVTLGPVESPGLYELYLRWGPKFICHPVMTHATTIEVANIRSHGELGQGWFTKLWDDVELQLFAHAQFVVIENVLNDRLGEFFERRGFVQYGPREVCGIEQPISLIKERAA